VTMALVLSDLIRVPLLAFNPANSVGVEIFELASVVFWTLDVAMSFRTGFYGGSHLEMDAREVARNYMATWMTLDIVIVISDWLARLLFIIGISVARITRATKFLKFFRLLRLVRIIKLSKTLSKLEDTIASSFAVLCIHLCKLAAGLLSHRALIYMRMVLHRSSIH